MRYASGLKDTAVSWFMVNLSDQYIIYWFYLLSSSPYCCGFSRISPRSTLLSSLHNPYRKNCWKNAEDTQVHTYSRDITPAVLQDTCLSDKCLLSSGLLFTQICHSLLIFNLLHSHVTCLQNLIFSYCGNFQNSCWSDLFSSCVTYY